MAVVGGEGLQADVLAKASRARSRRPRHFVKLAWSLLAGRVPMPWRYGWSEAPPQPSPGRTKVPSGRTTGFEGRAPLLYRGDVDTANSIIRSVLTSAQAGITWGGPPRGQSAPFDSGGRGRSEVMWVPRAPSHGQ